MNMDHPSPPRRAGKWQRIRAPSPSWREQLLSTCLTRLKSSREDLLQTKRQARLHVLHQEAQRARSYSYLPPPPLTDAELNALADELELEEKRLQAEVELSRRMSADDLAQLVAFHEQPFQGLVCPVCGVNGLDTTQNRLRCRCGLDVAMEGGEQVVSNRLAQVVEQHAGKCVKRLKFWQDLVPGVQGRFLWAGCEGCGVELIVL